MPPRRSRGQQQSDRADDLHLWPFTFLALSKPRLALGTVSAAFTDWESMSLGSQAGG
jgi:hypothetical protein